MRLYNTPYQAFLKVMRRKVYPALFRPYQRPVLKMLHELEVAQALIYDYLTSDEPCMIARYGEFELTTIVNYLYVTGKRKTTIIDYIKGEGWEWWWNRHTLENMTNNAGFWPATEANMVKYGDLCIADSAQADIIGSIIGLEYFLQEELKQATFIPFFNLEPFFSKKPWTRALRGQKVLVIHPFIDTISKQYYNNRIRLFDNPDILPEFDLRTFRAVQSIGGNDQFDDWFDALDYMKSCIDTMDFDIAIIGCGAYGFNLAAHIKRSGRKAIHLGGVTQLLFGIKGSRWETPNQEWYVNGNYPDLMNEYWCRPDINEQTDSLKKVENSCYV